MQHLHLTSGMGFPCGLGAAGIVENVCRCRRLVHDREATPATPTGHVARCLMLVEAGGGCTQEGGLWVNLGPLLYHWADAHSYLPGEELSIELALDAVIRACHAGGFRTLQNSMVPSVFNGNLRCSLPGLLNQDSHAPETRGVS